MKRKVTARLKKPTTHSRETSEHYLYTVGWSEDDAAYVARVAEFASLTAHGDSQDAALRSLQRVVRAVLKDLARSKEPIPSSSKSAHSVAISTSD